MKDIYSERLRSSLLERGWSQAELARRTGLDPGHISRYANGKMRPQRCNAKKILDALGLNEREFLSGQRMAPDEAQLHLLCEVEVLLGLARKLIEGHRQADPSGLERDADPDRMIVHATYEALDRKVGAIRAMIRRHNRSTAGDRTSADSSRTLSA